MADPKLGEPSGIRFGRFVLYLNTRTLLKSGRELRIQAQPLSLLCILAGRPGELVTREELHGLLWPGVAFLDFDAALNSTLRKLRQALEDDASSPSFIRTVPRKGYIFIAPANAAALSLSPLEREGRTIPITVGQRLEIRSPIPVQDEAEQEPEPTPASEPEPIPEPEHQLETSRSDASTPSAIQPRMHRRTKAFLVAGVLIVALIGGAVIIGTRRTHVLNFNAVRYTMNSLENSLIDCAISPDGRYLAYVDQHHVSVTTIASSSANILANLDGLSVSGVSWFPDSATLLVTASESAGNAHALWRASILGNQPPVEIFTGVFDARVAPDGKHYAVISADREEIKLYTVDRFQTHFLVHGGRIEHIYWSPDSTRIYFTSLSNWVYRIESVGVQGGKPEILEETRAFDSAVALPDNRLLYSAGVWPDSGTEFFELRSNRVTGRRESGPTLLRRMPEFDVRSLSASSDGSRIAYLQGEWQAGLWISDLTDGDTRLQNARRLTFDDAQSYPHGWTHDSRAVLFESTRVSREWSVYKQSPGTTEPQALLFNASPAVAAVSSPDGKWLMYLTFHRVPGSGTNSIMRIPAEGGSPVELCSAKTRASYHCPRIPGRPCVIGEVSEGRLIFSYVDPVRGRIGKWREYLPESTDWDLSPDGATLAILDTTPEGNRIVLLKGDEAPHSLVVPGVRNLKSINWWANGEGFFSSCQNKGVASMLSISLGLNVSELVKDLGGLPTWGVPSPDGKMLVYVNHQRHFNAWITNEHP